MDGPAVAHAVFDALDAGDFERFASLFTKDAVIWQNTLREELPVAEIAELLKTVKGAVRSARYEDRRYAPLADGAACQHVLRATLKDGRTVEVHAMLHVYADDGRIRRIEEYFDTAETAVMSAELNLA